MDVGGQEAKGELMEQCLNEFELSLKTGLTCLMQNSMVLIYLCFVVENEKWTRHKFYNLVTLLKKNWKHKKLSKVHVHGFNFTDIFV